MKVDFNTVKDIVFTVGAIGGLLVGGSRFVGKVDKVPTLERKVARIEHAQSYLVQGMEQLTHRRYIPPREDEQDEGANR
jgi:hypothetical protein